MLHLFRAHATALYALCSCAEQRAELTHTPVTLTLDSDNHTYRLDDEPVRSLGCILGALQGTYGPPSKPTRLITRPVTGAQCVENLYAITWGPRGLSRAATIYLSTPYGHQAALTMPRARAAPPRLYWRSRDMPPYDTSWRTS